MPKANSASPAIWRSFARRASRESDLTGVIHADAWRGFYTRINQRARPWSVASQLQIVAEDWKRAWPMLLAQLESDQLSVIKEDTSGAVYSGEVVLAGRPISVIVKRPLRKYWYRYITDLFRGAKPQRVWRKAWQLIARDIDCEWPMLVMQRRELGYPVDGLIVFEKVPGVPLDRFDLDSISAADRDTLLRRAGHATRAIEKAGLAHYDAKSTNWIVYQPPTCPPRPIIIDLDGVRPLNVWLVSKGIRRLLRAMSQHPQYTLADSLALCRGYAPYARHLLDESERTS